MFLATWVHPALAGEPPPLPPPAPDPPPARDEREDWLLAEPGGEAPALPASAAPARRPRGALHAPESERTLLLGVGAGVCFVGGKWSSAGVCAKADFSYLFLFAGGAVAVGAEVGYERYSDIVEPGLIPEGPTATDMSGLTLGVSIAVRFAKRDAVVTPYLGATPLVVVQSSRYMVGSATVDTSTEFVGVRPFIGAEVRLGPGAVYVDAGYRATKALAPSDPHARHDGGELTAGYRLRF